MVVHISLVLRAVTFKVIFVYASKVRYKRCLPFVLQDLALVPYFFVSVFKEEVSSIADEPSVRGVVYDVYDQCDSEVHAHACHETDQA